MFGGLGHLRNITRNTRFVRLRKGGRRRPNQPDGPIFVVMLGLAILFFVLILMALNRS